MVHQFETQHFLCTTNETKHTFEPMVIYHLLRFWVGNGLRLWFKKIYYDFEEPLPKDAPIIFACTHPNSAVDYTFLPLVTHKKASVMVRGDVFENKWINKILRALWMLPVYRMRDGIQTISKNKDSFRECFDEFDKNGWVLIFSEGTSVQEKKLQPLMKGTARLAIDYCLKAKGKEIYVVPMVNNYGRFRQFRGDVSTHFGKPIKVSEYVDWDAQHQAKPYQKLTKDVHTALDKLLIQPDEYEDDSPTEKALNVLRFNRLDERKEWIIEDRRVFDEEQKLTNAFNTHGANLLSEDWWERYDKLEVDEHLEGILQRSRRKDVHWMVMFSSAIVMAPANVIHFLPYQLAHWIARNKIKDPLFENTIMTIGSSVFYLLQFLLVFVVLTIWLGWAGFVTSMSILAITTLYIELVDDYRFAKFNSNRVKNWKDYKALFDELIARID